MVAALPCPLPTISGQLTPTGASEGVDTAVPGVEVGVVLFVGVGVVVAVAAVAVAVAVEFPLTAGHVSIVAR